MWGTFRLALSRLAEAPIAREVYRTEPTRAS